MQAKLTFILLAATQFQLLQRAPREEQLYQLAKTIDVPLIIRLS